MLDAAHVSQNDLIKIYKDWLFCTSSGLFACQIYYYCYFCAVCTVHKPFIGFVGDFLVWQCNGWSSQTSMLCPGLHHPCGSLPTQNVPLFCDSVDPEFSFWAGWSNGC